ncbi:hypothetical protein LTR78_001105 [Recurvomyces mirabilis]|uniref:Copper transport protein n=1 Tax=Recurvomyces mirabilis TaxID=574656 RepID=A0AAE0WX79_9PEZI|nr:hypothetical protein LTR78_001105 [Recurvomyces mirabilis]KAK5159077.1 hypothetical protein LTS14_003185 [Recurvomyces mirabilis]
MATSTSMGMSSMTGMSMPSATSSTSSSMSGMMGMDSMMMVFFSATNTPLYSTAWMPNGTGQYAGACIFLIVLSLLFRGLMAVRCNFTLLWTRWTRHNETPMLHREEDEIYLKHGGRRPWRINEAATRAILDTTLAAVSYLLMLAVMTMNVGYFLSILGGTFLGSFTVGGWTGATAH